jgi:hypothetical protein
MHPLTQYHCAATIAGMVGVRIGMPAHCGQTDVLLRFIQMEVTGMAKAIVRRSKRTRDDVPSRARSSRAGWVRKNVVMDQRKLDAARHALGVDTETEAIDLALDFVAFRREIAEGIAAVRHAGDVEDVFERRRRA